MNYSAIRYCDIANGLGIRVSLFVSGCPHHCKNCFNPETWNKDNGQYFSPKVKDELLDKLSESYIKGITIIGGEPLTEYNQEEVYKLCKSIKFNEKFANKDIWVYTGYNFSDIPRLSFTNYLLSYIDVLVDGPFIEELKDPRLKFRGSSNQRIIDMKNTLSSNKIIELDL